MKARPSAKAFHVIISFACIRMKANLHNKNFALSLAFIMRFTAIQKWLITVDDKTEYSFPVHH